MVFYTWQAQHASRLNLNFRPTNHLTIIRISRYSNRVDLNKICNCIIWYRNGPSYFGKRKGRFNYNCLNFVSVFHNWTHYGSSVRHAALIISLLLSYFSKRYLFQPSNHKILALHAFFLSYFRKNQNWSRLLSGMTTWVVVALRAAASLDGALYLWGCKDLCRPLGRRYGINLKQWFHYYGIKFVQCAIP